MGGGDGDDVLEAELVPVMLPGSTGAAPDADAESERERGLSPLREEELAGAEDWANLVPEDSPLPTPVPRSRDPACLACSGRPDTDMRACAQQVHQPSTSRKCVDLLLAIHAVP